MKNRIAEQNFTILYYARLISVLLLTFCFGCNSKTELKAIDNNEEIYLYGEKRIDSLISQFDNSDELIRQSSVQSLFQIAKEDHISRKVVILKLIRAFDTFRSDKNLLVLSEEIPKLKCFIKLFQDLNAIEAVDVLVKYNASRGNTSSFDPLIDKAVELFGEESIPSLEKELKNPNELVRQKSALTLCGLKFKKDKELGINRVIEILEEAKETENERDVRENIDQAISILYRRKRLGY